MSTQHTHFFSKIISEKRTQQTLAESLYMERPKINIQKLNSGYQQLVRIKQQKKKIN